MGTTRPRACGLPNCNKSPPYRCPRCSLPYCSVACYQAHSDYCLQQSQKAQLEPLRDKTVSEEERRRFQFIVQRIREAGFGGGGYEDIVHEEQSEEEESEDEEEDGRLLEQFMQGLDEEGKEVVFGLVHKGMEEREREREREGERHDHSNIRKELPTGDIADELERLVEDMESIEMGYEEILSRLPFQLRQDFEASLRDGRAGQLVKPWRPWWISGNGEDEDEDEEVEEQTQLPPLPKREAMLVQVENTRGGSKCVLFSIVQVILAYCKALRTCNGERGTEVGQHIWKSAAVVREDRRYGNMNQVCEEWVEQQNDTNGLWDAGCVLGGGSDWVARALYETQSMLQQYSKPSLHGKDIRRSVRKVAYFVAWSLALDNTTWLNSSRTLLNLAQRNVRQGVELEVAERVGKMMSKVRLYST